MTFTQLRNQVDAFAANMPPSSKCIGSGHWHRNFAVRWPTP